MPETNWEVVYETNGSFVAEILRGLLEAQEIPVVLSQEGIAAGVWLDRRDIGTGSNSGTQPTNWSAPSKSWKNMRIALSQTWGLTDTEMPDGETGDAEQSVEITD